MDEEVISLKSDCGGINMCCEPLITIWGTEMTIAQSMTIRAALEVFEKDLEENGCGEDEQGIKMSEFYLKNIYEIRSIILGFRIPNLM